MSNEENKPLNIEDVLFFEQTSFRKFLKEQKVIQDDQQPEITTSTLKPQMVRSQKIKRQATVPVLGPEYSVGSFSALLSANTIRTFVPNSNDSSHIHYSERQKICALSLLDEINGMLLHCKIVGIQFPQGLENILNYGWKDFIKDVTYTKRTWPPATCKFASLQRRFSQRSAHGRISIESVLSESDNIRSITQMPTVEMHARPARDERGSVESIPFEGKKKSKGKQQKVGSAKGDHPTGFTINFSTSSKVSMEQGWIIKQYDETLAKMDWRTVYSLMLEKIQVEHLKIKLQKKNMAKHGFDKPVILLHYEEARTELLSKYKKQIPVPVFALKDGKPPIPAMKVENHALNKLHYALNDGSCIIYYPSGNIAVCRSYSGLSCPGAFYTNVFNDSSIQPTLLASFTPFGHGSIFLSGEGSKVLLYNENGGLIIDEKEITTKYWKWPKRGKLPETIWMQVNDYITVWIHGQFSINLTYKWKYELIRFPLSPLPDVIPPDPDEMGELQSDIPFSSLSVKSILKRNGSSQKIRDSKFIKKQSNRQRPVEFLGDLPRVSKITIYSLRQLYKRIKSIVDNWMEYYRKETGLTKFSKMMAAEPDLQAPKGLLTVDPLNLPGATKDVHPDTANYIHFLSTPGIDKIKCVPHSCTFTSNWPDPISTEDSLAVLLPSRRGPFIRTNVKHNFLISKVQKEERMWLRSPGRCPVALRSAMMGEGMKCCKCSPVKVPNITDLEFDTFIKGAAPEIQQIILVCVVSSHVKPMTCENMIQELYEERNRNRSQPCTQSRLDPFRMLKYDMSTANNDTGQSSALLVERHNVTPGMFLMYIGGKLLFADNIFNGYSNTEKDLKKQITKSYEDFLKGHHLLHDFRFSSFNSELPSIEMDNRRWTSHPDHRVRPRSEASTLPGTCILQTSDRAATIQDFIALNLSQGRGCCKGSVH
ncbi:uncharacterized protein [Narcine bancroftii]|uniref:uncharacterized protein n=1 Tax=Narcine bancroftii TaxID=1343680 RepID=UPI0038314209